MIFISLITRVFDMELSEGGSGLFENVEKIHNAGSYILSMISDPVVTKS